MKFSEDAILKLGSVRDLTGGWQMLDALMRSQRPEPAELSAGNPCCCVTVPCCAAAF